MRSGAPSRCAAEPSAVRLALAGLVALLLAAVLGVLAAPAALGQEVEGVSARLSSGSAAPGERITIVGDRWPAGTQVQASVCGDLGLGGSTACDLSTAQLGTAAADGTIDISLVVGKPPAPCPCVVRVASFTGLLLAVDAPFTVEGHPVGDPPGPTVPTPRLVVVDSTLTGEASFGEWFGAPATRTLTLTVQNVGSAPAVDPVVAVGVGRSAEAAAEPLGAGPDTIDPLQTATVEVEVGLPFAAFGDYYVVAAAGSDEQARVATPWAAFPWGLVVLNILGLLLIAWGVSRRLRARRRAREAARGAAPLDPAAYPLPDVVFVASLGGFLVSPQAAGRSGLLKRLDGRLESEDLAALVAVATGAALAGQGIDGQPLVGPRDEGAGSGTGAVVDLVALERWFRLRDGLPPPASDMVEPRERPDDADADADAGRASAVVDLDALDRFLERRELAG